MCRCLPEHNPDHGVGVVICRKALRLGLGFVRLIVWIISLTTAGVASCNESIANSVYHIYLLTAMPSVFLCCDGDASVVYQLSLVLTGFSIVDQIPCDNQNLRNYLLVDCSLGVVVLVIYLLTQGYRYRESRRRIQLGHPFGQQLLPASKQYDNAILV